MVRPIAVKALGEFRLWLEYEDGASGEIDLSDLAGRGVFAAWTKDELFGAVSISASGALQWPGGIDLCGDAMYLRMTGKPPEELFPSLKVATVDS